MAPEYRVSILGTAKRQSKYSPGPLRYTSLLCLFVVAACYDPDPRNVRGALAGAAQAVEADDAIQLYRFVDQRARHALGGIIHARHAAKALIEADYPAALRPKALADLGDGATAQDANALFAMRCQQPCLQKLRRTLGAPATQAVDGDTVVVETTRGTSVRLFLGSDTWYGLVLNTDQWVAERDQASRELKQIEENAALYRKKSQLGHTTP